MPIQPTAEALGLSQEDFDYVSGNAPIEAYDHSSKVDILQTRKQEKINTLSGRVGLSDTDRNREVNLYTEDGFVDNMGNKIANQYSPEELQYLIGRTYKEMGVFEGPDGYLTYENDRLVPFRGDSRDLASYYAFGTRGSDDVVKTGIWGRTDPTERYTSRSGDKDLDRYGDPIGEEGVDVQKRGMNLLLPRGVNELLENLQHGNMGTLDNRYARRTSLDDPEYDAARERFGSGMTEAYTGGYVGAFGGEGDVTRLGDKERLWNDFKEKYGLGSVNAPVQVQDRDMSVEAIRERILEREADRMGFGGRVANTAKGFLTSLTKELIVDLADAISEGVFDKDLGSEEEKRKFVSDLFGYNYKVTENASAEASKYATSIWEAIQDDKKKVELSDVANLMKVGFKTPEYLGESLGALVGMLVGFGKFTATGKAIKGVESDYKAGKITKKEAKAQVKEIKSTESLLNKASRVSLNNAGFAAVVTGNVNDRLDEFMEANDGEYSLSDVARITAGETVIAGVDRYVDLTILRNTPIAEVLNIKGIKEIVPDMDAQSYIRATKSVAAGASKLAASGVVEGATEYAQTLGEIFNARYATKKYGTDVGKILLEDQAQIEAIAGAGIGAAMGVEMSAIGQVRSQVSAAKMGEVVQSGIDKAKERVQQEQPTANMTKEDLVEQEVRAESARQVVEEYQNSPSVEEQIQQSQESGDVAQIEYKIKQITQQIRAMEDLGEFDYAELGRQELEQLKAQLPHTRVLGSDPVERQVVISDLFEMLGEQGVDTSTVEQFAQVNQLNNQERQLLTKSVEQGTKVAKIKKNLASTSKEVKEGARGYLTYYNNVKDALVRGETDKVDDNLQKLGRFTAAQVEKVASFKNAEQQVYRSLADEIQKTAQERGVSEAEATNIVRSKYVVGKEGKPTVQKFKYPSGAGTYTINKGTVFERRFDGNTNPIGFYRLLDEVESEVALMQDIYESLASQVLGEDVSTVKPQDTTSGGVVQTADITELDQEQTGMPDMMDDSVFEGIKAEPVVQTQPDVMDESQWEGLEQMAEQVAQQEKQDMFESVEQQSSTTSKGKGYYTSTVSPRVDKFRKSKERLVEVEKELVNDPSNPELLSEREELLAQLEAASPIVLQKSASMTQPFNPAAGMVLNEDWKPTDGLGKLLKIRATGLNVEEVELSEGLKADIDKVVGNRTSIYRSQVPAVHMLRGTGSDYINPHVAIAIESATQGWLAENAGLLTTPKDMDEIAEMLGIDVNDIDIDMLVMFADGGELLKYAADSIGQKAVEYLGIRGDNVVESLEAGIRSGLGLIGLTVAQERGWVQDLDKTKIGYGEASTGVVKVSTKLFEDMDMIRGRNEDFEAAFGINVDTSRNYRTTKPKTKKKIQIRNQPYTEVTEVQKEAIEVLEGMTFELNSGVDVLLEMYPERQDLLDGLGWVDTSNGTWKKETPLDLQLATMGKNRSIEVAVDSLLEVAESKVDAMYFEWFVTKAGRYNLDSTRLNPQTDKNLARWLVTSKNSKANIDKAVLDGLTGKEDITNRTEAEKRAVMFAYGVVQAFDGSSIEGLPAIDKNSEVEIVGAAKKILGMSREELVGYAKEADHLGHAASAIANIDRYKAEGDVFESDIQIEFDGLTNGFSFKTMQHPILSYEDMKAWWRKIGVVTDDSVDSMNQREEGFEDVYMAAGAVASDDNRLETLLSEDGSVEWDNLVEARVSDMQKVMDKLGMPATLEGKTLRNLMKGPVMTFVYSAGIPSIKKAIVKDKINEFLVGVTKKDENGNYLVGNKELIKILGLSDIENPRKMLSTTSLLDPKMKRIRNALTNHFMVIYANPVGAALKDTFGPFIELNGAINNAFSLAYEVFKTKYESSDPMHMSKEMKQQFIKDNIALAPMIKGPDSKELKDQILIMSRKLEQLDLGSMKDTIPGEAYIKTRTLVPAPGERYDTSKVVQLVLRGLGVPGAAGNVLPIQTMDGSVMGRTLKDSKIGFLGVHDAEVLGVNQFDSVTSYNKNWWKVNDDSALVQDTIDMLERVEQEAKKQGIITESIVINVNSENPLSIADVKTILKGYQNTINTNRVALDREGTLKVGQMVGPRGTMAKRMDKDKANTVTKVRTPKIEVGSWVKYKDSVRLVTEMVGTNKVRLVNPKLKGSNINVIVNKKNVTLTTHNKVDKIVKGGTEYLVTPKGTVINLTTNRKEDWQYVSETVQDVAERDKAVSKINATVEQINKASKEC